MADGPSKSILFDPEARRMAAARQRREHYAKLEQGLQNKAMERRIQDLAQRSGSLGPAKLRLRDRVAQKLMGDNPGKARRDFAAGLTGSDGLGGTDRTPLGLGLADLLPVSPFGIDESMGDGIAGSTALEILPGAAGKALRGAGALKAGARAGLLPLASGGLAKRGAKKLMDAIKGSDMPAPAIRTEERVFDYSTLDQVPDVPQFDLPRHQPARGVSARVGDLVNDSKVIRGVEDVVARGEGMGGMEWYNTDQLRQRFVAELGEEQGTAAYRRYMDMVAATSPRSRVGENARNASFYYMLDRQGLPMPTDADKLPKPYGHMAQKLHKGNARAVAEEGGWDVFKNPKPASFVENLVGNQRPVTVDAHAFKLPALFSRDPRFLGTSYQSSEGAERINPRKLMASGQLSMEDALKTPAMWDSKPMDNEYGALEAMYQDIAQRRGISPAQAQASAWVGGGDDTGLQSSADPFLKVFEDRLALTAEKTGLTKEQVLRQFIQGQVALHKKGGYVTAKGC